MHLNPLLTGARVCWQDYRERVLRHEAAHFLCAILVLIILIWAACMPVRSCVLLALFLEYLQGLCKFALAACVTAL